MAIATANPGRRALSKERRRTQLIDATIACIARKGLGGVTLGDVSRAAGLSQGIVNLHFHSKENLLRETLRFIAEDYDAQLMATVERCAPDASATLLALMELDLDPAICDRRKLAVWFAFWGEVKSVPTYRKICAAIDEKHRSILCGLCQQVIDQSTNRHADAEVITDGLSAMTDGLWLAYLLNPKTFDREQALKSIYSYLSAVFPDHFPPRGKKQ